MFRLGLNTVLLNKMTLHSRGLFKLWAVQKIQVILINFFLEKKTCKLKVLYTIVGYTKKENVAFIPREKNKVLCRSIALI